MCDDGSLYWHALDFADDAIGFDCPDLELSYPKEDTSSQDDDDFDDDNTYGMRVNNGRLPRRKSRYDE